MIRKVILALVLLAAFAPMAEAAKPFVGIGSNEACRVFETPKIVGVTEAGEIQFCIKHPGAVPDADGPAQFSATLSTPPLQAGSVLVVDIVPEAGCAVDSTPADRSANTASGAMLSRTRTLTFDGSASTCHGYAYATVTDPTSAVIFDHYLAFTIADNSGTNETLDAFTVLAPLLFFVGLILWAETSKEMLVYVLAAVAGITLLLGLWAELEGLRLAITGALALVVLRASQSIKEIRNLED